MKKNYTVAFCDYQGTIFKGTGIIANSPGDASGACLDWIFEHRDFGHEIE